MRGKSSIMMALFRIAEVDRPDDSSSSGIYIDGKNCSTAVPLHTLREKLSIIPQDQFYSLEAVVSNLIHSISTVMLSCGLCLML